MEEPLENRPLQEPLNPDVRGSLPPAPLEELRQHVLDTIPDVRSNPMFSPKMEANVLKLLPEDQSSPGLNDHEQPIVKPHGVNFFGTSPREVIRANAEYEHDIHPLVREKAFTFSERVAPPDTIILESLIGASGIHARDRGLGFSRMLGVPLQCVDVDLLMVPGRHWSIGPMADIMQPLKSNDLGAIFPFVGDIFADGIKVVGTDPETSLPIQSTAFPGPNYDRSKPPDPEQNDIVRGKYPMYLHGGRSVLMPVSGLVPVVRTEQGGYEVVIDQSKLQAYMEDEALAERDGFRYLSSVATQYIGVGVRRYTYHATTKTEDGRVDLQPNEVIVDCSGIGRIAGGSVELVQNTEYAGETGIFLDVRHQPDAGAPTGGLTTADKAIEMDRLLLAHGAELAGITLGSLVVATKDEVDEKLGRDSGMVCDQIAIAFRAILEDTLRLDVLTVGSDDDRVAPTPGMAEFLRRDFGEYSDSARDTYLTNTNRIVAHNLRICARLGLSIKPFQPTAENLSIYGKIIDSENFQKVDNPYQLVHLACGWIENMQELAAAGGLSCSEYLRSPHFRQFCETVLSPQALEQLPVEQLPVLTDRYKMLPAATELTTALVLDQFREQGRGIPLDGLLEEYRQGGLLKRLLESATHEPGARAVRDLAAGGSVVAFDPDTGRVISEGDAKEEIRRYLERHYVRLAVMLQNADLYWSQEERDSVRELVPEKLPVNVQFGAGPIRRPKAESAARPGGSLLNADAFVAPPGEMQRQIDQTEGGLPRKLPVSAGNREPKDLRRSNEERRKRRKKRSQQLQNKKRNRKKK